MDCYVCGYPLPEGANFCPNCGRNRAAAPVIPEEELLPLDPVPEEEPVVPAVEAPPIPAPQPPESKIPAPETPGTESPDTEPAPEADAVPTAEEPTPIVTEPVKAKRRPLLLPALIMAGMFLVGLVCFLLFPFETDGPGTPSSPAIQAPQEPSSPESPPLPERNTQNSQGTSRSEEFVPADASCFELTGNTIRFLPDKYDGGRVLVIPNEIDGTEVTAIADYGFANCDGITTIILPDGLKTIGSYAFNGCDDLRGVYFPDSLREIGRGAFNWCISLEAVSVPTGVKTIGADAFDGCASLMYIFYSGTYEDWVELYNEYITPFTWVSCLDGDYNHGVYPS